MSSTLWGLAAVRKLSFEWFAYLLDVADLFLSLYISMWLMLPVF